MENNPVQMLNKFGQPRRIDSDGKIYVGSKIPVDMFERVEARAKAEDLSVSWLIRAALKDYLARYGEAA
jgi:Ribbon-helix-helix protein, copG family